MLNPTLKKSKSELLLPVANMKMCLAAIHNGADAIYVGVPEFNARGRTTDLTLIELKEMIDTCHLYGVKVNLAFNIVIFESELVEVVELLGQIIPLAPDAIIVQDIGLAKIIRQMAPTQVIHGSTQMTVTNHEAMSLLADLEIKRFVLGREVSMPEMKAIKEKTKSELEVFVHGALCVAYSGQCFTSESIGGRSANRGQCAQSCRFEYDMIVDGKKIDLQEKKYLVSPKDLCGLEEIPELITLGIDSFKVEGRLKTPEYVASAAKNYRNAINHQILSLNPLNPSEIQDAKKELGLTYSRGFFSGWLHGVDHQALVDGTYGAHRGVPIGTVQSIKSKSIIIKTLEHLKKGDGILFAASTPSGKQIEVGGKIYDLKTTLDAELTELFFAREFNLLNVQKGFIVYLNHDDLVDKKLAKSYQDKNLQKKIPLCFEVEAKVGSPLKIKVSDGIRTVENQSESCLELAQKSALTKEQIEDELSALSQTCFKTQEFSFKGPENIYLHQKELKVMRRYVVEEMMKQRIACHVPAVIPFELPKKVPTLDIQSRKLNILLRDYSQVASLLSFTEQLGDLLGVVFLDFEFGREYGPSVEILRQKNIKVGIATTRILKPNEYYNFKVIERANPDVILCRNLGAVQYFSESRFELRGDFSLNVTNSIAHQYLSEKKLKTICASYDLNSKQLEDLIKNCDSNTVEVTIHQYMPSFHMEHCVFAAFLSKGSSFKDCGKPCEKHRVELKDQFGNFHQIKADQECRNTMFNSKAFSLSDKILSFKKLGATEFRFEALYENEMELKEKIISLKNLIQIPDFR
jgi:putative protease